jgi:hypothetical protein
VEPGDPLTFAAAVCGILAVALVASLVPARRAASVDPWWRCGTIEAEAQQHLFTGAA